MYLEVQILMFLSQNGEVKLLFFWNVSALWGKLNIDFLTVSGLWLDPCVQKYTVTPLCGCHKKKKKKKEPADDI